MKDLRRMVKHAHGRGLIICQHRSGWMQIMRRWEDGTTTSCTSSLAWKASSTPALLALIERLTELPNPAKDGVQVLSLAKAASLVQSDGTDSAHSIRHGAVDWLAAASAAPYTSPA